MKYSEIEGMCHIRGTVDTPFARGCPHDGLGCIGSKYCSINSKDSEISGRAFNADKYGPDFRCYKWDKFKLPAKGKK